MRSKFSALLCLFLAIFVFAPASGFACSVCYGDPTSPMVQGAKAGVLFLAGVIYLQLMLMGGVGAFWYFRARKLARDREMADLLSPRPPVDPT